MPLSMVIQLLPNPRNSYVRIMISQSPSLTNSSSDSRTPLQSVLFPAPSLVRSFSGWPVSAAPGASLRFLPKVCHLAHVSRTATSIPAKKSTLCAAEGLVSMVVSANCSSETEPLVEQAFGPAQIFGSFVASLVSTVGGLLGSAGNSVRGDIQGRGNEGGEEKVGAVKDLLRLGCALVTPGVGTAQSSGGWVSQYFPLRQDILAGLATLAGAVAFLQIFNEFAKREVLEKTLSRKLVHIGVGLGFMLFWPLFTSSKIAPYLAAFAPASNTVRLLLVGLGWLHSEAVVKSMTRDGDPRELLKGPLYYGLAVVVTTVGFWRTSPVGIVALVNLCAGDGFADILGRNFGTNKLPYNRDKSFVGTVGFFITSSLLSIIYLGYFSAFGFLEILPGTFYGVALVSFLTAVVESLPISTCLDDNLTVPLTAIVLGMLILPGS